MMTTDCDDAELRRMSVASWARGMINDCDGLPLMMTTDCELGEGYAHRHGWPRMTTDCDGFPLIVLATHHRHRCR